MVFGVWTYLHGVWGMDIPAGCLGYVHTCRVFRVCSVKVYKAVVCGVERERVYIPAGCLWCGLRDRTYLQGVCGVD